HAPAPVPVIVARSPFPSAPLFPSPPLFRSPTKSFVSRPRLMLPPAVSELVVPTVIAPVCATPPPAVEVRLEPTLVTPKLVSVPQIGRAHVSAPLTPETTPPTASRSPDPVAV